MLLQKIALITDSSCDLDKKTLEQYNINMLPFRIIYSDGEFLDKITITSEEMFKSLEKEVPTTSLPDLAYTENILNKIKADGYTDAIVIPVSSGLSGTYNSLRLIMEDFEGINFHFFDSKTLGFPVGAITIEAAKLIANGESVESIMEKLPDIRDRVTGYVTLDTIDYLIKGGRIGRVAGAIGKVLHLKPIIASSEDGVLYPYAKARGRKKAVSKMKEILDMHLEKAKCRVWVLDGYAREEARAFFENIKNDPRISEISLENIGPAMGIHTGPGALGICILENK